MPVRRPFGLRLSKASYKTLCSKITTINRANYDHMMLTLASLYEFVRRFMLHILPKRVKRIRHYGVLASACKGRRLAQARAALAMPTSNPQARESAAQFMCRIKALEIMRCPCCALGQLRLVQTVPAPDRLPAPGATVQASGCRDPPCLQ